MKRILTCLLTFTGLMSACGQKNYEDAGVEEFAALTGDPQVAVVDVRTAEEYAEGHIDGALNIDVRQDDFLTKATAALTKEKKIAVYCRSGRRSASAAGKLAAEGYQCVNLKGGITAWKEAGKPVTTDTYEKDVFKTASGKTLTIHALVHASLRMTCGGKAYYIDPVTKLGNKTVDYSAMPKADYILITHEHGDHFDKEAIRQLTGDHTRLITNKRCADMLGFGEVMNNGDTKTTDDLKIEAVPAYNTTEGHLQFHPKGRDNGYILTVDGLRIYVAGDTEDIPEMGAVSDIDIAFMPCNQPYTMTPDQLVKAARTVKPKVLFPYHFGQTDVNGIPAQLKSDSIDVRIRKF